MKMLRRLIYIALIAVTASSCSVLRGLRLDGAYGPHCFSFVNRDYETVARGGQSFSFPAGRRAEWIDTLHFYTVNGRDKLYTLPEAMDFKPASQGVMIFHRDSLVYDRYWGEMTADRVATVFSVSKSITSLLCGIAVDDGCIRSIDDPVTDYIPELRDRDPHWQRLTVRHLLDMQSGLDFDDTYSMSLKDLKRVRAIAHLNYGRNVMRQVRNLKFRCEPGTEHFYESMTSQILGIVIERATQRPFAEYLSEKVWQPLEMESEGAVNVDKRGLAQSFGGISLTLKDLAKIGRLYLHGGVWNGRRIVSEEWIRQSSAYDSSNDGYHFNWYNTSSSGMKKPAHPGFYALGIGGQVLYANPDRDLIMVRIGVRSVEPAFLPELFEELANIWPED